MHLISDIALKWICRQFPWWHFYDDFSVVSSNFCCIVSCRKICSLFLLEFCCSVLLYFSCTALALDLMNLKTGIVLQWAVLVLVVKFQVHQASIYVAKLKIPPIKVPMTRIFHWFFMWKMDPMSVCDIHLVFTLPPRDSTLQYKRCVHLWNNFPCIKSLHQPFYLLEYYSTLYGYYGFYSRL